MRYSYDDWKKKPPLNKFKLKTKQITGSSQENHPVCKSIKNVRIERTTDVLNTAAQGHGDPGAVSPLVLCETRSIAPALCSRIIIVLL